MLAVHETPSRPTDEAMDGIAFVNFVDRKLQVPAPECVPARIEPVRPGHEGLSATTAAHFIDRIPVEDSDAAGLVSAQTAADLDHRRRLVAVVDLPLLTRRLHGEKTKQL